MDTVILTNNPLTPRKESIKFVVVKNEAETILADSKEVITCSETSEKLNAETCNPEKPVNKSSQSSVRTGFSQTPIDIRGQGDSKNMHIRPYSIEKTGKLLGTPDFSRSSFGTSASGNATGAIFVPYMVKVAKEHVAKEHDVLEEMKRKLAQSFAKQQNLQRIEQDANDPKSSRVPGTNIEYRTPGAHYKNKNGKIKRPMNAFMVWARDYRGYLASSMPNATNSEISVKLGQLWASMPPAEKKKYYDTAEKIKAKHRLDYPDWVYQPSAPSLKKRDDVLVYTRTPTPPLSFPSARQEQTASINITDEDISGLRPESGKVVQSQLFTTLGTTAGNIGSDFGDYHVLNNSDICCQTLQQNAQNENRNIGGTSTDKTNIRPSPVTRVSYQSALEIPTENTVTETTRGLLACKLSQGRTDNSTKAYSDGRRNEQRTSFLLGSDIPMTSMQLHQPTDINGTVKTSQSMTSTPFKMLPVQQPRIMGIVNPSPNGMANVRFHAVRPSLQKDVIQIIPGEPRFQFMTPTHGSRPQMIPVTQNISQMVPGLQTVIPITPGSQKVIPLTPKLVQKETLPQSRQVDCVRGPMGIPIVETHVSPMSVNIQSLNQGINDATLSPSVPETHVLRQSNIVQSSIINNDGNKMVAGDSFQTNSEAISDDKPALANGHYANRTSSVDCDNFKTNTEEDDSNTPKMNSEPVASDPLLSKSYASKTLFEGSQLEDIDEMTKKHKQEEGLWPFPFSENPADWDIKEFPKAVYLELYDPYDPFLSADTLLTDQFPGSLELDMNRWDHYLGEEIDYDNDDCDQNPDVFLSLQDEEADDISISPLPLKQTLCRLLNAHVQTSESGDIITGDLVTEVTTFEDDDNEFEENVEGDLLTHEMAAEISCVLEETTEDKDLNQQITQNILENILDEITLANNSKTKIKDSKSFTSAFNEINRTNQESYAKVNTNVESLHDKELGPDNITTTTIDIDSERLKTESKEYVCIKAKENSKSEICLTEKSFDNCTKKEDFVNNDTDENQTNEENSPEESYEITDNEKANDITEILDEAEENIEYSDELKVSTNTLVISRNTRSKSRAKQLP